jgi:hypothetical protein
MSKYSLCRNAVSMWHYIQTSPREKPAICNQHLHAMTHWWKYKTKDNISMTTKFQKQSTLVTDKRQQWTNLLGLTVVNKHYMFQSPVTNTKLKAKVWMLHQNPETQSEREGEGERDGERGGQSSSLNQSSCQLFFMPWIHSSFNCYILV